MFLLSDISQLIAIVFRILKFDQGLSFVLIPDHAIRTQMPTALRTAEADPKSPEPDALAEMEVWCFVQRSKGPM